MEASELENGFNSSIQYDKHGMYDIEKVLCSSY